MPKIEFDERIAAAYDQVSGHMFAPAVLAETVAFLAPLAGGRPALEFAVGTGRVALPLSQAGVRVHGIDLSAAMVALLQAKLGSAAVGVTIGDIATTRVDGEFGLVYLVYNTITNLLTQDEQVACFANAAAHLGPGGCFVIECGVPELRLVPPGQTMRVFRATPTRIDFDTYDDFVAQILSSHHYWPGEDRLEVFAAPYRYVWPSELDLMARLAGLRLRERWCSWARAPFTGDSPTHISVWEKPA